jgi:soluble lytic murein transglycosylase
LAKLSDGYWQEWPEQLLLNYPRPYIDAFQRQSMDSGVEVETMLAITRQESLFDATAASPAGAYGLMQIIPETAKRFAAEIGLRLDHPSTELLRADFNLKIGARYLRHLEKHYSGLKPAVFAAYNAGEGAVDAWVMRRVHSDPTVWVELIPYGETRNYVKKVWSNHMLYKRLTTNERISMMVK